MILYSKQWRLFIIIFSIEVVEKITMTQDDFIAIIEKVHKYILFKEII